MFQKRSNSIYRLRPCADTVRWLDNNSPRSSCQANTTSSHPYKKSSSDDTITLILPCHHLRDFLPPNSHHRARAYSIQDGSSRWYSHLQPLLLPGQTQPSLSFHGKIYRPSAIRHPQTPAGRTTEGLPDPVFQRSCLVVAGASGD
jgi:hypothetical protein